MIESMACGTPVLAMPGGSVAEIVCDGLSGYVSSSVASLARRATNLDLDPDEIRAYVEKSFSAERMARDYIHLYNELAGDQAGTEVQGLVA
jgi:glycosyltransferase involved in cell wall biosynthesis